MSHPAAAYATTQPGAQPGALVMPAPYVLPPDEQQAQWSEARLGQECGNWLQRTYPHAYAVFFHIPNGGLRTAVEGNLFKLQHARAGVPDYFLAWPQQHPDPYEAPYFYGLFIELKTQTGRVAPAQAAWHQLLAAQGYRVEVVRSLPEFINLLTEYLA